MNRMLDRRTFSLYALVLAMLIGMSGVAGAQSATGAQKNQDQESVQALERDFFAAIRSGDSNKILSYIPESGVSVGSDGQHASRDQIQQQFQARQGLYCKLFDSSCIKTPIQLDNSSPSCSYRELLTHSEKVRTAASEVTRNGVEQAVLVAQVDNAKCPSQKLIDLIFNLQADGWKLFSIP